nr:hypothetical protein [uncultured Lichenicoccus sp.]
MSLAGIGVIGGPFTRAALPLGISFFTFTQIGFLIDVRQGVGPAIAGCSTTCCSSASFRT